MRVRIVLVILIVLMLGDFIARGVIPAFTERKNDFSDPYCAAWLWRHGQNPYDVAQATGVSIPMAKSYVQIVPVYPPTAYVLVAPLTLLPWKWANVVWALLGVAAVTAIAVALVKIGQFTRKDSAFWIIAAFVFSFAPFHTGLHVANVGPLSIALCLVGVYLATRERDLVAGVALAIGTCLKPQLGIWVLIFYALRRRWSLVAAASLTGALVAGIAVVRIPLSLTALFMNYRENLHYWFGIGGQNDFTAANSLHFQLVNAQVVLYPLVHNVVAANAMAWSMFALGLAIWGAAIWRSAIWRSAIWGSAVLRGHSCSDALALSSLLALSVIPFYHRSYDIGILTLALCWALNETRIPLRTAVWATFVLLVLLLTPGQAVFIRVQPYLLPSIASSWWWNLVVAPYEVWTLLLLNVTLLYALCSFRWGFNAVPNRGEHD